MLRTIYFNKCLEQKLVANAYNETFEQMFITKAHNKCLEQKLITNAYNEIFIIDVKQSIELNILTNAESRVRFYVDGVSIEEILFYTLLINGYQFEYVIALFCWAVKMKGEEDVSSKQKEEIINMIGNLELIFNKIDETLCENRASIGHFLRLETNPKRVLAKFINIDYFKIKLLGKQDKYSHFEYADVVLLWCEEFCDPKKSVYVIECLIEFYSVINNCDIKDFTFVEEHKKAHIFFKNIEITEIYFIESPIFLIDNIIPGSEFSILEVLRKYAKMEYADTSIPIEFHNELMKIAFKNDMFDSLWKSSCKYADERLLDYFPFVYCIQNHYHLLTDLPTGKTLEIIYKLTDNQVKIYNLDTTIPHGLREYRFKLDQSTYSIYNLGTLQSVFVAKHNNIFYCSPRCIIYLIFLNWLLRREIMENVALPSEEFIDKCISTTMTQGYAFGRKQIKHNN